MTPAARRGWSLVAGGALLVVAWGVALVTPADDAAVTPFSVEMRADEPASGRNIAVTLHDVRRAESVSAGDSSMEGNWVAVDLEAQALVEESGASMGLAQLQVDGATHRASERPESFFRTGLAVGIPKTGSLAFELPASVTSGTAVLTLGLWTDPRLDSVLQHEFELEDLDVQRETTLLPTDWGTR